MIDAAINTSNGNELANALNNNPQDRIHTRLTFDMITIFLRIINIFIPRQILNPHTTHLHNIYLKFYHPHHIQINLNYTNSRYLPN